MEIFQLPPVEYGWVKIKKWQTFMFIKSILLFYDKRTTSKDKNGCHLWPLQQYWSRCLCNCCTLCCRPCNGWAHNNNIEANTTFSYMASDSSCFHQVKYSLGPVIVSKALPLYKNSVKLSHPLIEVYHKVVRFLLQSNFWKAPE